MRSVKDFFTPANLAALSNLDFRLLKAVPGGYSGARKSAAIGNSLELSDFKEYSYGDNIGHIDWNSYGRLNRLVVKQFQEEKQATISIFLDCSKSMDFGEPNKLFFAKVLTAAAAYVALCRGDKVVVTAWGASMSPEKYSSKAQFNRLLAFLDGAAPQAKLSLSDCVKNFAASKQNSDKTIIISDFFDDGISEQINGLSIIGATAVQVLSPAEAQPELTEEFSGPLKLTDSETEQVQDLLLQGDILEKYMQLLQGFKQELEDTCRKRRIKYIFTTTECSPIKLLGHV